jgi:hypothetical protein
METFKVKIGGGKFKARFMNLDEKINEKSLYSYSNYGSAEGLRTKILDGQNVQFYPSKCVGELVSEHAPDKRVYIEVLSSHYATFPDPMND